MCCCVIIIESTNQIAENIFTIGEGSEPIIISLEGRRATPKRKVGFFELQKSQTSPLVDGCVHLMLLATAREYRDRGANSTGVYTQNTEKRESRICIVRRGRLR